MKRRILGIMVKTEFLGIILGILWATVYYFMLDVSEINVPLTHALLYGGLLGAIFSAINLMVLLIFTNGTPSNLKTIIIRVVVIIINALICTLFSPTLTYLVINIVAISIFAIFLTKYVLTRLYRQPQHD